MAPRSINRDQVRLTSGTATGRCTDTARTLACCAGANPSIHERRTANPLMSWRAPRGGLNTRPSKFANDALESGARTLA
eukprot:2199460-Lingulodinium_polyedra.AAC.1